MRSATRVSFSFSTLAITSFIPSIRLLNQSKRSLVRSRYSSDLSRITERSYTFYYSCELRTCNSATSRRSCSIYSELSSFFFAKILQSSSWHETVSFRACTFRSRDLTYSTFDNFLYISTSSFNLWHSKPSLSASLRPSCSRNATNPNKSSIFLSRSCSHYLLVRSIAFMALLRVTPSLRRYLRANSGSLKKRQGLRCACSSWKTSRKLLSTSEKLVRTKNAARTIQSPLFSPF